MALTSKAQVVFNLLNGKPGISRIEGQVETPRNIAGTNKLSEHVWGNALDVYGSVTQLTEWAKELDSKRSQYGIKVLCYDPGVGRKYDHCTTKHTDHMHVDFAPHCSGHVSASGSTTARATACNAYQGGNPIDPGGDVEDPGFIGGIVNDIIGPIQETLTTALYVALGVVLVVGGIVLLAKDTAIGDAAVGLATKGLVK